MIQLYHIRTYMYTYIYPIVMATAEIYYIYKLKEGSSRLDWDI